MIKTYLSPEAIAADCTFETPRDGDAGIDISAFVPSDLPFDVISPGRQAAISTGLHLEIPEGYVGIIKERSGLARTKRVHVNAGIIDSSYSGEVLVLLENRGKEHFKIYPGDKIAQLLVVPYISHVSPVESLDDLAVTQRGEAGFGSTNEH